MPWVSRLTLLLFIAGVFLTQAALGDDQNISCYHCHSKQVTEFQKSVHFNKGISCVYCHGGKLQSNYSVVSLDVMSGNFIGRPTRENITRICSKCHPKEASDYKQSIHWKELTKGRKQPPSCTDCHSAHEILSPKNPKSMTNSDNIPLLCSNCHENQTTMQAWYYGIKTDKFDTYKKSYHYKAHVAGAKGIATCADCHRYHDIRSENDPQSAIYPANLPDTCGKPGCHPGAQNAVFYGGKVHEEQSVFFGPIDAKKLITRFYILMIFFELIFTFGLIFLGISSNFEMKRRH